MRKCSNKMSVKITAMLFVCVLVASFFPAYTRAQAPEFLFAEESQSDAQPQEETPALPALDPDGCLYPGDFEVVAPGAYLVNEDTGAVVYAKNANQQMVMASLTKMMTAMLVVEHVQDMDAEMISTGDKTWIYDELFGKNASTADIRPGETLPVRELMYGMLLPSGNEAALLLADYVSGGYMKNFLYMMNTRAEKLGCTNTVFVDPNGLSEGNLTTPRDMYLITKAFMQYPELVEIAATPSFEISAHEQHTGPYLIHTTNKLIDVNSPYYHEFASTAGVVQAGKTGSLGAWQNFASIAQKDGVTYYCVVLNSPNEADAIATRLEAADARPALYETAVLYNNVFTNFSVQSVLDTEKPVTEVSVQYSTESDAVKLYPESDVQTVLKNDADSTVVLKTFDVPDYAMAPVKKGDVVGSVTLSLAGQPIGESALMAEKDVSRNNTLYAIRKIQDFLSSPYFKVLVAAIFVFIGIYAILVVQASKKRAQKRSQKKRRPPRF